MDFKVTDDHLKRLKSYLDCESEKGHDYRNKLAMYVANKFTSQQIALLLANKSINNKRIRSSIWKMVKRVRVNNKAELQEVCRKYFKMD